MMGLCGGEDVEGEEDVEGALETNCASTTPRKNIVPCTMRFTNNNVCRLEVDTEEAQLLGTRLVQYRLIHEVEVV